MTTPLSAWRERLARWSPVPDPNVANRWLARPPEGAATIDVVALGGGHAPAITLPLAAPWPHLVIMPRDQVLTDAGALATGDEALDAAAAILGATLHAGLFDHALRGHLVALVRAGGYIAAGHVHLPAHAARAVSAEDIEALLDRLPRIARALQPLSSTHNDEAIVRISIDDPDLVVRAFYRGLATDPARVHVAVRHAVLAARDTSACDELERHMADRTLPITLRTLAASKLLQLATNPRIVNIPDETWGGIDVDALAAQLVEVHARATPAEAPWAPALARRFGYGRYGALHADLARLILDNLAPTWNPDDEPMLLSMLGRPEPALAKTVGAHILAHVPLVRLPVLMHERPLVWQQVLREPLLDRLVRELEAPAADIDATRALVLTMVLAVATPDELPVRAAQDFARLLAPWSDARGLALLTALLSHRDRTTRDYAFGALLTSRHDARAILAAIPPSALPQIVRAAPSVARQRLAGAALLVALLPSVSEREAALRVAYLDALGHLGDPIGVRAALNELGSPYDDVQYAAMRALGRIGTPSELDDLEPYSKGLFRSGTTKDLAREAMLAIVARHGDASGGLSLADPDAPGRVTIVPSAAVGDRDG